MILWQHSPKPYKLLIFFMTSVIFLKMDKHSDFRISSFRVWPKKEFIWFWGTLSQNYRRLGGSLTMFQEPYLDPSSTLEHQTWSKNQSQHDLLYGGVNLSICWNLKLAPVPYATPKWPIQRAVLWRDLRLSVWFWLTTIWMILKAVVEIMV